MANYFPNVDPIYLYKRKGSEDDPFLFLSENIYIKNGSVVLNEIPSSTKKISVFYNGDELTEEMDPHVDLTPDKYRVDYTTGVVNFNNQINNKNILIEYWGTGYVTIPSNRIKLQGTSEDVTETLQQVLDNVSSGLDTIEMAGEFSFIGEYDESFKYKVLNIISFEGDLYISTKDSIGKIPDSNPDYWKLVLSGISPAGVFDPQKTYRVNDLVSNSGKSSLFVSRKDQNNEPLDNHDYWEEVITVNELITLLNEELNQFTNSANSLIQNLENTEQILGVNELDRQNNFESLVNSFNDYKELVEEFIDTLEQNSEEMNDSESQRQASETQREQNEVVRENNEIARESSEQSRNSQFSNISNTVEGYIQTIDDLLDNIDDNITNLTSIKNEVLDLKGEVEGRIGDFDSFVHFGEYNPTTEYKKNNMVYYEGSTYVAKSTVVGITPQTTAFWSMVAKKGLDGDSITVNDIEPDEEGNIDLEILGFVKNSELQSELSLLESTLNMKTGDLSELKTTNKTDIVSAINELKRKIDDLIDVIV